MIRILLVDDQSLIRQGLKALLQLDVDLQVVGTADNGEKAIEQVQALKPDIVLIDIRMPGMDGVTATQIISKHFDKTKVIVLSGYDDDEYLANALQAGARGYLLKDTPAEEIANVIKSVHKGYAQLGPGLFEKISLKNPSEAALMPAAPDLSELTPLKRETLEQFKTFEPKTLTSLVRRAIEQGKVAELFSVINPHLQNEPTNLAALYLAGSLWIHKGQGHRVLALNYLKNGFKEGVKQGLSREHLLLFYKEAVLLEPEEAFTWLTRVEGPWSDEEGLSFLLQEAKQKFGKDSPHCRTLTLLWQVRSIRALSDSCNSLGRMVVKLLNRGEEKRINQLEKV